MSISMADEDHKDRIEAVEHAEARQMTGDKGEQVVVESAFAGLSRLQTIRTFRRCIGYVLLACCCALNDGYEFSIPNSVINIQAFVDEFGIVDSVTGVAALSPRVVSLWNGLQQIGIVSGQILGAALNDRVGRKGAMYGLTVCFVIGAILSVVAHEWRVWLAGRFIFGTGMGMCQMTITTYVSEIAPTQVRGTMLAVYSLSFAIGQFLSAVCIKVLQDKTPALWRRAIYTQWIFIGIWILILPWMPESPWHLARKHQHEKAKRSLARLYKGVPEWDADREYLVLQAELAHAEATKPAWGNSRFIEIFRGVNGRRTLASIIGPAMQQLVGVPIFFTYITYFFAQSGVHDPFLATIIMYCLYISALVISFWTSELVGRRPLLLWGAALMFSANIGLGITGSFKVINSAAAVAMSCIWVFTYSLTSAPVAFMISGETSTPRLRAYTNGLALAVFGSLGAMFTFVVPYMLDTQHANWGVKSGYLFGGGCLLSFLAVFFFVPETAGRTYAELDELWESGISVQKFAKAKTAAQQSGAFELRPARTNV